MSAQAVLDNATADVECTEAIWREVTINADPELDRVVVVSGAAEFWWAFAAQGLDGAALTDMPRHKVAGGEGFSLPFPAIPDLRLYVACTATGTVQITPIALPRRPVR